MFEYIRLVNYKSFEDITLDLTDRQGQPKKMVLIYGENGIGKSNIASAFSFLGDSLRTMNVRDMIESILAKRPEVVDEEFFSSFIKSQLKDLEALIKDCKMVSSEGSMSLEFGFKLNGKSGRYIIETNDSEIIHERLEYILSRNRGQYFDITPLKASISPRIFSGKDAYQEIKTACKKYWGKHTLLSIILHEAEDKADSYIDEQIGENFDTVLSFLTSISCKLNFPSNRQVGGIAIPNEMLRDYEKGTISEDDEYILDNNERILNLFFKSLLSSTDHVFYKRLKDESKIHYQLYHSKLIARKNREIPFEMESTGTQSLLQLLPFMLLAVNGATVIIDEFDVGLHNLLTKKLLDSLFENVKGQLIMTTHATVIMEADLAIYLYLLKESSDGKKSILPLSYYEKKRGTATNFEKRYLDGEYGGIPENDIAVDFNNMLDILGM